MRISDWSSDVCSSDLIAIGVEHRRALILARLVAQDPLRDQPVHIGVRLVQPQPAHVGALQPQHLHLLDDHVGDHRHDLLEHLAARSEEHTSELQSLMRISYAVFCLKKKKDLAKTYQHKITIDY